MEIEGLFREAFTPYHGLAYLLDPEAEEGRPELPADLKEKARNMVAEKGDGQLGALIAFETEDTTVFPSITFSKAAKKSTAPRYWAYVAKICDDAEGKKFADMMHRIFLLPSSSAGIERIFSKAGLVHSKLRNRLHLTKVGRLVKVARLLRVAKGMGEGTALPNLEELFLDDDDDQE